MYPMQYTNARDTFAGEANGWDLCTDERIESLAGTPYSARRDDVVQSASCVVAAYDAIRPRDVTGREAISSRKVRPISRWYSRG